MAASKRALERGDQWISLAAPKGRPGLIVFILHCVFESEAEALSGAIDPHERATVEGLRGLIRYFRAHGHEFVSAAQIEAGLAPQGRYAHLTFDDGFANNLRLLDLAAEEGVHATVFPSINHIRSGRAFWWNSTYRELAREGRLAELPAETARLRQMVDDRIDAHLAARFGERALEPCGDIDRPLSVAELRTLAHSKWIEIGNHTMDHAVLTNYPADEVRAQIVDAQSWLTETLGETPRTIAYPNGDVDGEIVAVAAAAGLRLGFTVEAGMNRLPLTPATRMELRRARILFDARATQRMRAARSPLQMTGVARRLGLRAARPGKTADLP